MTPEKPKFPTEPEIELWEWLIQIAELEEQLRAEEPSTPEGGGILELFGSGEGCVPLCDEQS